MSSWHSADIYVRPLTERYPTSGQNCFWTSLRCPLDILLTSTHDLLPNGTRHRDGIVFDIITMSSRHSADIYARPLTERNPTSGRDCFWTSLRCPLDILPTSTHDLLPNGTRHRDEFVFGHHYDVLLTFCRHLRTTSYQTEPDIGTGLFLNIITMSSRHSADIYARPLTERKPTSGRDCFWISSRCPLRLSADIRLVPFGRCRQNVERTS